MSSRGLVNVGTGMLRVDRVAPRTYEYRVADFAVLLQDRGCLTLPEGKCEDNRFEALSELISRLFTAAGVREERRQGGEVCVEEAEFSQDTLDWVDARHDLLEAAETSVRVEAGTGLC